MTTRMHAVRQPQARGMIFIHSTPAALCPHLEWAINGVLGSTHTLHWQDQPVAPGTRRSESSWGGAAGSGAVLASKLAGFERIRFEITEEPSPGADGQRYSFTPTLGSFSTAIGVHGDVLVSEERLKHAVARDALGSESIYDAVEKLLGTPWDDELEVFRHASEEAPVRWLHQVV